MSPRTAPSGARAWVACGVVAVGVLSGASTIRPLVQPGDWFRTTVVTVLAVALTTAVARALTRSRLAPTAWGTGAALVAVPALFAGPGRLTLPLPTLETVRTLQRVVASGAQEIGAGYIPVPPTRGVELLVVAGALAAFLVADALAVGLGRAGLAGLPLAGIWSVVLVFEERPSFVALLLGGTSYLVLLALTRPVRHRARGDAAGDGVLVAGTAAVVTVAALVVAPTAAALPFWGTLDLPTTWGEGTSGTGPVELSVDLDMRESLGDRSDRPVLAYTVDGPAPGPLRLYTLTTFDGVRWLGERGAGDARDAEGPLWPDGRGRDVLEQAQEDDRLSVVRVEVGALDQDRLPLPIEPRSVELDGDDWSYDPVRDEVSAEGTTTRGLTYEVVTAQRDLSEEALQTDGAAPVGGASEYLLLPSTSFADDVAAVAREVTAQAQTDYDRAVALQTYLRDGSLFRYDTDVPEPVTDDAVWDFLTARTGYCVQYATAFTVMARHLGLPTRMGVGFLPGRASTGERGRYVVTGRLAHTWPEVWFEGAGWVRFEPTPAVQTGAPPAYADPLAGEFQTAEPQLPTAGATPGAPVTPSVAPSRAPVQQGEVALGGARVPLVLVLVVAGLLAVGTVAGALTVGRRSAGPEPVGPEPAWERLRARCAAAGVTWSDATTPRQAAAVVRTAWADRAGPEAEEALRGLVAAVESARWAPEPPSWDARTLDEWVTDVISPLVAGEDRAETVGAGAPRGPA
ncbi:DUF3488 and transglutaminase-like domain-containing protein [Cellulomonas carbonis]|uniref:Transglutaminase-like domain-containing protein n=1 Tax=Cellulomonas carbonis T26 TaxID=947969 RepID=A0A0A0BW72_9CELL|nr:DUF3488 and transglutaminase-like domain-containing protein [Cellulomonas carbonis]KGM12166.1 hypothetical protein N868_01710 [Cellulomonas carbonis T26]GGB97126.1 transglutaminase [Cellulomonas carbonis]